MKKPASIIVLSYLLICVMAQSVSNVASLLRPTASLPATCTPYSVRSASTGLRICNAAGTGWNLVPSSSAALTAGRLPYVAAGPVLADSANATLNASGQASLATLAIGSPSVAAGVVDVNGFGVIGPNAAVSGAGGNWRYRDDTGTSRWLTGLLGSGGATAFSIYDLVNGKTPFSITANTADNTFNLTPTGVGIGSIVLFNGTPQTLTGAGAVNITTDTTLLVTTGANALTLAAGNVGQIKTITMITDAGDGTLTPTNPIGYATITFNDVGDTVQLKYINSKWIIIGSYGVVIA